MKEGMIGLEIHVYLRTKEKLFCRCRASREKGLKSNLNVCPVCTGMPGAKPMSPNGDAVKKSVIIGLMLGCKINNSLLWYRKHYDWPDMPKGYQNTISGAHAKPLGIGGNFLGIRINSMHLEEDPASWDPKSGCVDYNRSGLPLVEIVTEPDFVSSEETYDWLRKLVHALSYLKIVDKDAGIKADVNVNIPGKTERVEVKNINSLENIKKAIEYELIRQSKEGGVRETRRFDELKEKTMRMRSKEEEADYRFIPDPDLMEIKLEKSFILDLEKSLPESPQEKLSKMIKKYKIGKKNAEILIRNIDIANFFEEVLETKRCDENWAKFALPWVTVELLRVLNWNKKFLDDVDIRVKDFVKLLELVKSKKITELQAKQILNKFVPKSFDPSKTEGKIDSEDELRKIAKKAISGNKKAATDYKDGDSKALNFLIGSVMKLTNRRADYAVAKKLLEEELR